MWRRFQNGKAIHSINSSNSFRESFQNMNSEPLNLEPLRILFATEYLPPYISGISNRCKNWINGYRALGHNVTVFSVKGSDCDVVVPSIPNPIYPLQRYHLTN
jgi:hypothetical protein